MDERRQSCVFAVDAQGRPLGVLTERDIVRLCHVHDDPQGLTLGETMKSPVRTTYRDALLHDVVKSMDEAHIRRLAVVDGDGAVCGVLTHHEVVNSLEGQYVNYLKDMIQEQEKVLMSRQVVVNERNLLENILRSATGTAVIAADAQWRVSYCNPAVAAMPKLQALAIKGTDLRQALAGLGWESCGEVLRPETLRDGRTHIQLLAWTTGAGNFSAEFQVSLLIDDKNQSQGYLLLAR